MNCIEPGTRANIYIVQDEEKDSPPEGFVDNTVKCGRIQPDGSIEWYGTMPAFPEGWDDPARFRLTPGSGLRKREEAEDMPKIRADRDEKLAKAKAIMAEGMNMSQAALAVGVPVGTLGGWLKNDKKQTPNPDPVPAANQDPDQGTQEPAGNSVAQVETEITVKDVLQYELAQREQQAFDEALAKQIREQQGLTVEDEDPAPYTVAGKYEALGKTIGALVDVKNQQYGDAFNQGGRILEVLYPLGIRPDQYRDMLGVIRIIDKLFRVANGKKGNEDPWQDICGYGLLGTGL